MDLIKPYAVLNHDKTADVYIDGPIEPILIADFNFKREIVKIYGSLKPLMLTQLYSMYNDLKKEVERESEISDNDS
tara:strand:+ start:202 stop:429 length:228 start_codon:yes stop_codon:yes gene_type:complete